MEQAAFKLGDIVEYIHPVWSPLSPNPPSLHSLGKIVEVQPPSSDHAGDGGHRLAVRWGLDMQENPNISIVSEYHVKLLAEGNETEERISRYRELFREAVDAIGIESFRELLEPYMERTISQPAPTRSRKVLSKSILMDFRDDLD